LKGNPPAKIDTETGGLKRIIGNGDAGIDIGTAAVAALSRTDVKILELADKAKKYRKRKM